MMPTSWGHRFESVIRRIFELEIAGATPGTVLDGLGRFRHADPAYSWLRASPDGLVMRGPLAGRLVEIKAPKTRQPGDFVPLEYWVQMQVQMEVTDLDAVEFVEAQFQQRPVDSVDLVDSIDSEGLKDKGSKGSKWCGEIQVVGERDNNATWRYRYTEPSECVEDIRFDTEEGNERVEVLEHTRWWLTGFYPRTVLRDRDWWETVGRPAADTFWAEYQEAIKAGPSLTNDSTPVTGVVVEREGWAGSM